MIAGHKFNLFIFIVSHSTSTSENNNSRRRAIAGLVWNGNLPFQFAKHNLFHFVCSRHFLLSFVCLNNFIYCWPDVRRLGAKQNHTNERFNHFAEFNSYKFESLQNAKHMFRVNETDCEWEKTRGETRSGSVPQLKRNKLSKSLFFQRYDTMEWAVCLMNCVGVNSLVWLRLRLFVFSNWI